MSAAPSLLEQTNRTPPPGRLSMTETPTFSERQRMTTTPSSSERLMTRFIGRGSIGPACGPVRQNDHRANEGPPSRPAFALSPPADGKPQPVHATVRPILPDAGSGERQHCRQEDRNPRGCSTRKREHNPSLSHANAYGQSSRDASS